VFWLAPVLSALGVSDSMIIAVILGDMIAVFGFGSWVLTDVTPPVPIGKRVFRSAIMVVSFLAFSLASGYFGSVFIFFGGLALTLFTAKRLQCI
jgi:hypothetical protein